MTSTPEDAVLGMLSDSGQTVSSDDEDIRGYKVMDRHGNDIGKVDNLLVDDREHKVRLMLVEHGGFLGLGRTTSFIPVDDITQIAHREVHINHAKNHVSNGPGYDPELVHDQPYLGSVYEHYGIAPYWGAGYQYPGYPYYPAMHSNR